MGMGGGMGMGMGMQGGGNMSMFSSPSNAPGIPSPGFGVTPIPKGLGGGAAGGPAMGGGPKLGPKPGASMLGEAMPDKKADPLDSGLSDLVGGMMMSAKAKH